MLRRALLVHSLAVFLFAGFASAAAPATKVVIAYSSLNERGAGALLVARDQGFFRKYDLDVSLIFMRSGAVALSALSAGEAQFYSGSANGSALGAMAGGLDLVFIAGLANQLNGTMVAAPSIHSPADLKRKNIAIQSIGGGVWMITQLLLIRLFQQDTRYSVRAWRGQRFPVVCENSSGSSPAKRAVRSIWPPVVGLMDLSVRDVGTSVRMS